MTPSRRQTVDRHDARPGSAVAGVLPADLASELRAPTAAVIDGVDALLAGCRDPQQATALWAIRAHGELLLRLLDRPTSPPTTSGQLASTPLAGSDILVVEGAIDQQLLISVLLKTAGANVVMVDDGRSALDLALAADRGRYRFHAVLVDLAAPGLGALALTRRLREAGYDGGIIAMSANDSATVRARCLDADVDAFLAKPFAIERFLTAYLRARPGPPAPPRL